MQLTISTNFPEVQRQIDRLAKDIADKATASALNKIVAQAKTAMSKEIRTEYNIRAADVSRSLRITRARATGGRVKLEAELSSISRPGRRSLNLAHFIGSGSLKSFSTRKNRTLSPAFKIKRGGPRKRIPGSFLINQGKTLMIRTGEPKRIMTRGVNQGKLREPIKALQTIDVPSMFNARRINRKVVQLIEAKFPAIFANEAAFFTARFNAGR